MCVMINDGRLRMSEKNGYISVTIVEEGPFGWETVCDTSVLGLEGDAIYANKNHNYAWAKAFMPCLNVIKLLILC